MRRLCRSCGREKMLHFCPLGLHCNDCEKTNPCPACPEHADRRLHIAAVDLRQAAEDLEADGDVDGSGLHAISDIIFGASSLVDEVAKERERDDEITRAKLINQNYPGPQADMELRQAEKTLNA